MSAPCLFSSSFIELKGPGHPYQIITSHKELTTSWSSWLSWGTLSILQFLDHPSLIPNYEYYCHLVTSTLRSVFRNYRERDFHLFLAEWSPRSESPGSFPQSTVLQVTQPQPLQEFHRGLLCLWRTPFPVSLLHLQTHFHFKLKKKSTGDNTPESGLTHPTPFLEGRTPGSFSGCWSPKMAHALLTPLHITCGQPQLQ